MKCPEKDLLMLYVDKELEPNEFSSIKSHITHCKKCKQQVDFFEEELEAEILLRNKVTSFFNQHSQLNNIMSAVNKEPRPVVTSKNSFNWINFLLKFLLPALTVAVIFLFLFMMGTNTQAPNKFEVRKFRVSVTANNINTKCYVDNNLYTATNSFELKPEVFNELDGKFTINVEAPNKFYSIKLDGMTDISFDKENMFVVLDNCAANLAVDFNEPIPLKVNGKLYNLSENKLIRIEPQSLKFDENLANNIDEDYSEAVASLSIIEKDKSKSISSLPIIFKNELSNMDSKSESSDLEEELDDYYVSLDELSNSLTETENNDISEEEASSGSIKIKSRHTFSE